MGGRGSVAFLKGEVKGVHGHFGCWEGPSASIVFTTARNGAVSACARTTTPLGMVRQLMLRASTASARLNIAIASLYPRSQDQACPRS